jgi:hypothetical protein
MDRRQFLAVALAAFAAPRVAAQAPPMRTQWRVRSSEALDAIAFLGPLSGRDLYREPYAADADAFAPRLPEAVRAEVPRLWNEAEQAGFGLLWPVTALIASGGRVDTLDDLIAALEAPETRFRPAYQASSYWLETDWAWFSTHAPRLRAVLAALRDAGFAAFRQQQGAGLEAQVRETAGGLARYDVIRWQEKLTGRSFDPVIEVVLLRWSKPHGVKVLGQTFLQSGDYNAATTVRIAAHEMLHPPFPMDGAAARAVKAVLERDETIMRIIRDHDPQWGYTTLDGMLNEDVCQALDQLISEALGVARNPADRWRQSDDGMHVIAAGLYGLLRDDRWVETGGSIEQWIADAAARGRLAPATFHPVAARVLERPVDRLWPLPAA